jgi:hypothetical protein
MFSPNEQNKTTDQSFDDYVNEFERFITVSTRLASEVRLFSTRTSEYFSTATLAYQAAVDLYTPLSSVSATTAATTGGAEANVFAGTSRAGGAAQLQRAATESCEAYRSASSSHLSGVRDALTMSGDAFARIADEVTEIKGLIARRGDALKEYDYYNNKVEGLQKDKETTLGNGKQYKSGDQEKLDRNLEKLRERRTIFDGEHERTQARLLQFLSGRFDKVEPAMMYFARAQSLFAAGLTAATNVAASGASSGGAAVKMDDFFGAEGSARNGVVPEAPPQQHWSAPPPPPAAARRGSNPGMPLPPPPPQNTSDCSVPVMAPSY